MIKNKLKYSHLVAVMLVGISMVFNLNSAAWSAGLNSTESDGYLQWMHSLEKAMQSRSDTGLEEGNLLYPFDLPGWQGEETRPYRHLSISKAVNELEREWLLRGESSTNSSLVALANARNYVNLSEFDSALVWFETASNLDKSKNFTREISRERLAAAAANRDSLAVLTSITNAIGSSSITGHETEYILALRWLLIHQDSETMDLVIKKINSDSSVLTSRLRFWVAFSLAWRENRTESLDHLRILVCSGGLSRDLTEKQRAWVLFAIPDILFLEGDSSSAKSLYDLLKNSSLPELSTWGRFQIANLDFLGGRYLRASEGFKRVCDAKRLGSWQDQACEMANVAREIERIKSEGEPYGAGSFYTP